MHTVPTICPWTSMGSIVFPWNKKINSFPYCLGFINMPYLWNYCCCCCGQERNEPQFFVKLQVVERHVQPWDYDKTCECQRQRHGGIWNLNEYTAIWNPFFNSLHPLRNAQPTRVLVSIYLCWGWLFICDLNTSAGEHLYVLQMCVCERVCVCPPCS